MPPLDNPAGVAAPFADRFSHVARVELGGSSLLLLSGQVAVNDTGQVVAPGDITTQAERIFELIGAILAAHGGDFGDVLHVRSFLTNLDDLPGYAAVRQRVFPTTPRPASTTVEVGRLFLDGAVLEIEVTAAVTRKASTPT